MGALTVWRQEAGSFPPEVVSLLQTFAGQSVLLMLLVRRGVDENVPVLATSMLRYRKDGGWLQSPASRRLLQSKSAAMLSVERTGNDIAVAVVEHESIPAGTQVVYKDSLITV